MQESGMFKRAALLVLLCVSIAGWSSCGGSTSSHYVYATSANQVLAFREDPHSGVLTPVPGSPFATGNGARSAVLAPSKKFLYVANSGDNDISLFTVSKGTLTEVSPRISTNGTPLFMAIDPAGAYLYVATIAPSNPISVFSISSSTGALTAFGSSLTGVTATGMKLTPSGNFLFVASAGAPGSVSVFAVKAGVLSIVAQTTVGTNPVGLATDSGGSFLYVANSLDNSISSFSIDASGALTQVSSFVDLSTVPLALAVDPSGKYLYVANTGSNNITGYTISSGALTVLSASPFGGISSPGSIAVDPNDKYLLVGSQSSGGIAVYRLDASNGTLSSPATYSSGSSVTSIVVTD
jgi:6-phosphogluconolactonase